MISNVKYINPSAGRAAWARDKRERDERSRLNEMTMDPRRNPYTGQICAVFNEEEERYG